MKRILLLLTLTLTTTFISTFLFSKLDAKISRVVWDELTPTYAHAEAVPRIFTNSLGTVTGNVWEDLNGNGIFDGPDVTFGGSSICLFINDGTGTLIPAVMADGITPIPCTTGPSYAFTGVPPGSYAVSFEVTTGPYYLGTPCQAGGGSTPDPTLIPHFQNDVCYQCTPTSLNGFTAQFEVTDCNGAQNIADNIDAMYYQEVQFGNEIFLDGNNDCLNEGSVDQPYTKGDVQLTLQRECPPGSGAWTSSFYDINAALYPIQTTSAADGSYCYEDLPPGNYRMQVMLPQYLNLSDGQSIGGCNTPVNNGTAGSPQDSDIDPSGQMTNWIALRSGDPKETDLDIGVWKCIALGGTVWDDNNRNGILDNMEAGLNIIELEISSGSNTWDVTTSFQPGSANGGYWEISAYPTASVTACLSPGNYEVEVIQENFTPSIFGQLINWFSTIDGPVNSDIDGDDSGIGYMVTGAVVTESFFLESGFEPLGEPDDPLMSCDDSNNMTVDFGFYFDCAGGQSPFAIYFNCDDSMDDPLCDVGVIDNYCGSMPQDNNGTGPTPLCPTSCSVTGGITGVPHNTSWVSFIAANACISFDILPYNCQNGTGLQWGIVEAIDSPCNGGACVTCDANCNGSGVLGVSSCNFIPGNQYFLWLDGCNGTYCDYIFDNVTGAGTFNLPSIDMMECIGCLDPNPPAPGDPFIVPGGTNQVTFCVETSDPQFPNFYEFHKANYTWELDGVALPSTTYANCVSLDFSSYQEGDILSMQMNNVGNPCSNQASPVWTVEIDSSTFVLPTIDTVDCVGCLAPNPPAPGDPFIVTEGATAVTFCVETTDPQFPNYYANYNAPYTWEVDGVALSNTTNVNCVILDLSMYQAGDVFSVQMSHVANQASSAASPIWMVEIEAPTSLPSIDIEDCTGCVTPNPPAAGDPYRVSTAAALVTFCVETTDPQYPNFYANYISTYTWELDGVALPNTGTTHCMELDFSAYQAGDVIPVQMSHVANQVSSQSSRIWMVELEAPFILPAIDSVECIGCNTPNPPATGDPFIVAEGFNPVTFCVETTDPQFPDFYAGYTSTYNWEIDGVALANTTMINCVELEFSAYQVGDVVPVQMSYVANPNGSQSSPTWMVEIVEEILPLPSVDVEECFGCFEPNPPAPGNPYIVSKTANPVTFCVETTSPQFPNFYTNYISTYTWELDGVQLANTTMTNCVELDFSTYAEGDTIPVQMSHVANQISNESSPIWNVKIKETSSLNEPAFAEYLSVYPNPSSGKVWVDLERDSELISEIGTYDIDGKLVNKEVVNTSKKLLDLSDYVSGVYLLRVTTVNGSVVRKLIID